MGDQLWIYPWHNWTDIFRSKIGKCWNVCCRCLKMQKINLQTGNFKKVLERQNWSNSKALDWSLLRNYCCLRVTLVTRSWITTHTCRGGSWRMGHEEGYLPWKKSCKPGSNSPARTLIIWQSSSESHSQQTSTHLASVSAPALSVLTDSIQLWHISPSSSSELPTFRHDTSLIFQLKLYFRPKILAEARGVLPQ